MQIATILLILHLRATAQGCVSLGFRYENQEQHMVDPFTVCMLSSAALATTNVPWKCSENLFLQHMGPLKPTNQEIVTAFDPTWHLKDWHCGLWYLVGHSRLSQATGNLTLRPQVPVVYSLGPALPPHNITSIIYPRTSCYKFRHRLTIFTALKLQSVLSVTSIRLILLHICLTPSLAQAKPWVRAFPVARDRFHELTKSRFRTSAGLTQSSQSRVTIF